MRTLEKTTIVIWSDPAEIAAGSVEIHDLAREAVEGCAYCPKRTTVTVESPETDADWDSTEFFDAPEER